MPILYYRENNMAKRKINKKKQKIKTLKKANGRAAKNKREKTYGGVFSAAKDGYGFILADGDFDADLFVPAKFVRDAVSGDTVRFTVSEHNGREEAHISSVVSRGTKTFAGVYKYIKRREGNRLTVKHIVIADDRKLCFDTLISPAHLCGAVDGDKVLCEIRSYPDTTNSTPARGVIVKVYGNSEKLYPNVYAKLDESGVRTEFPEAAVEHAESSASRRVQSRGRLDLREERIFTIDGADSKDFDDAISVKRNGGGFVLGVHIADVSEYVPQGSPADEEALLRGTSVYFADRVIPMLPQSLSNGACSLNPKVNRYALSAVMDIDARGEIKDCRIYESVIRSKVRGVYSEVNDVLENGENSRFYKKYAPVFDNGGLEDITALYEVLKGKSDRRRTLELDSPEFYFETGGDGEVTEAGIRERGVSERMIEQFMLAANEAVASLLYERGLPCLYRVHGLPDAEKLLSLKAFASSLGIDASALDKTGATLSDIRKFTDAAKAAGKGEIISFLLLRCMMKAKYDTVRSGHFGLGADCYCHFTSPIRRYPDLFVHRVIKTLLIHRDGDKDRMLRAYAEKAAFASNECEDRATKLERAMDDLYMCSYTKSRIGEIYDAVITGVTSYGFFARVPYGAEGFVRISAVNAEFIPTLCTIKTPSKVYRPGDTVKIRIADVSIGACRMDFDLV